MPRPKAPRFLCCCPRVYYFKPRGVPLFRLNEKVLRMDEVEALNLHDVEGYEQMVAAKKMGISQPTFARILTSAHKKVSSALISGCAIRFDKEIEKIEV